MYSLPPDLLPILQYAAPPVVGAFIGYLTNKIAIKMLFRPLKPHHFLGLRVPMTPGVIPAKRYELAENMGKMVSDHLLTAAEISRAIDQDSVRNQVFQTIEREGEKLAEKDLGTLQSLFSHEFAPYYELGVQYIQFKGTQKIMDYLRSSEFEKLLSEKLDELAGIFFNRELSSILNEEQQNKLIDKLEQNISDKLYSFLVSEDFQGLLADQLKNKIGITLVNQKTLDDILSDSAKTILVNLVKAQTEPLLSGFSSLVRDKEVRQKIVDGACEGVEHFIASMGPMAAMVSNFVSIDMVREKIEEYLDEKEEDITAWFKSEELVKRVEHILDGQLAKLFSTPLVKLFSKADPEKINELGDTLAGYICNQLADKGFTSKLSSSLCTPLVLQIKEDPSIGSVLGKALGEENLYTIIDSLKKSLLNILQGESTKEFIEPVVEKLFGSILDKKIGRLSRIINVKMRQDIYKSLHGKTLDILKKEVPQVTNALNLQQIISSKINSLDLLKLEGLLLSIMEEQFKYINLFGALLGFILGCINLVFLGFS